MINAVLLFMALLFTLPPAGRAVQKSSPDSIQAQIDSLEQIVEWLKQERKQAASRIDSLKKLKTEIEAGLKVEEEGKKEGKAPEPEVVVISEAVGVEIDREERQRYELFKSVKGFVSAAYFKRPDGSYFVRLRTRDEEGRERTRTNTVVLAGIEFVRSRIRKHDQ